MDMNENNGMIGMIWVNYLRRANKVAVFLSNFLDTFNNMLHWRMTESVNSRMHATFERQFQMEAKDCTVCAHCYGRGKPPLFQFE